MYGLEWLLIVGLLVLLAPVLAIIALVKASNLNYEITRLHRMLREMQTQLAQLREARKPEAESAPAKEPVAEPRPAPAVPESMPPPERTVAEPPEEPVAHESPPDKPYVPTPPPAQPHRAPAGRPPTTGPFREQELARTRENLEHKLFSRWFVWLGGIAIALSAVFLVRYSIEMGWLGPTVRCVLGVAGGVVLIAAGELLRRHPIVRAAGIEAPPQVPPVLAGAGVSALFVSIYA
ncbi:MAG: DUF2339 domain-containing protein, partial [Alphaproteobacteria bacterium]|nr:DUF2339 domain-containing protein [Alphaproteobacteria bacterium]